MMQTLLVLATFAVVLPAGVVTKAVVRNVYSKAYYLGAKTFLSYVDKAELTTLLKDPRENLTVFAPTEMAFENLNPDARSRMDSDAAFLKELVSFHLVKGYQTVLTDNDVFNTMAEKDMGRVDVYTNPNMTLVSGSQVLLSGNQATNGVVVILTKVMYPLPAGTALRFVSADQYSMFSVALNKAGITSLLNMQDITLFAPTNDAFRRLPPGEFSALLEDIPLLTKVLQTHVVNSVVYSTYVKAKKGVVLDSLSGEKLNVTLAGNGSILQIGSATVTSLDVNVNNGVVHIIDSVLLPPISFRRGPGVPSFHVV